MNDRIWLAALAVMLGCAGSACARVASHEARPRSTQEVDVTVLVAGNTRFAVRLHEALSARPGNLFHSPFSISTAFAMTDAGARGATAEEMRAVLQLPPAPHAAMGALLRDLNGRRLEARWKGDPEGGKPPFQLAIANALWRQEGYPFEEAFLSILEHDYEADATALDLVGAPEEARVTINEWVEERTNDRIRDLIQAGDITPDLRLVLTNAIYFKSAWDEPFSEHATIDAPFHLLDAEPVEVKTMRRTGSMAFKDAGALDVVELPYLGGAAAMVLLVPKERDGVAALEARLGESLEAWLSELRPTRVALSLPRFRYECRFVLNDPLRELGMVDAFDRSKADFSGMSPTGELFLGFAIHQAFVEVNEEGTEAAAATALSFGATALPPEPRQVSVDRPFLFLIVDQETRSVLFMGRVVDPRG